MIGYMNRFMASMRPAFNRDATFSWFVCVFVGLVLRTDNFGVTSLVRALALGSTCYNSLLNFFRSLAWQVDGLTQQWWDWLKPDEVKARAGLFVDYHCPYHECLQKIARKGAKKRNISAQRTR